MAVEPAANTLLRRLEACESEMAAIRRELSASSAAPGASTDGKAPARPEPAWVPNAREDYDADGTVGATCMLCSAQAPLYARGIALLVIGVQLTLLYVVDAVWVPDHVHAFEAGNVHSHTVTVGRAGVMAPAGGGDDTAGAALPLNTSAAWTTPKNHWSQLSTLDGVAMELLSYVVLFFVALAGAHNVGTLDPLGWVSVYWRTSWWKAVVCWVYSVVLFFGVYYPTDALFGASQGLDILLNALALTFLVDLDEQLLAALLPTSVRSAVVAEYRDARDKLGPQGAGWKWHNRANKLWIALFLAAGGLMQNRLQ